jgi:hypothetical protein
MKPVSEWLTNRWCFDRRIRAAVKRSMETETDRQRKSGIWSKINRAKAARLEDPVHNPLSS